VGSDHYIKYSRNDGAYWSFAYAGAAYAPVAPANATATLTLDGNVYVAEVGVGNEAGHRVQKFKTVENH
jgi:hypothetical protein